MLPYLLHISSQVDGNEDADLELESGTMVCGDVKNVAEALTGALALISSHLLRIGGRETR